MQAYIITVLSRLFDLELYSLEITSQRNTNHENCNIDSYTGIDFILPYIGQF